MDLKTWTPFPYLDRDWNFEVPRLIREARFHPSIDVMKTEDRLVITAELPGMAADDVDVSLEGNVLTIKGEKAEESEVKEDDRYIHERDFGAFQRRVTVPEGVTADSITASFDNGVLTLEVQIPEDRTIEPHHIPVKTA